MKPWSCRNLCRLVVIQAFARRRPTFDGISVSDLFLGWRLGSTLGESDPCGNWIGGIVYIRLVGWDRTLQVMQQRYGLANWGGTMCQFVDST
eukprot:363203-Chlamydomonas_euryale.AAC.7